MKKIILTFCILFLFSGNIFADNYSLSFDGVDDYASVNDLATSGELTNNMAFTFNTWFKADGTLENQRYNSIIFSMHTSNGDNLFRIGLDRRANNGTIFYSDKYFPY